MYYFCESMRGDLAHLFLIESFQHGSSFRASLTKKRNIPRAMFPYLTRRQSSGSNAACWSSTCIPGHRAVASLPGATKSPAGCAALAGLLHARVDLGIRFDYSG